MWLSGSGSRTAGISAKILRMARIRSVETFLRQIAPGLASEHPLDWNRFYWFILLAHRYRKRWSAHDVQAILEQHGLPAEKADKFAKAYWHGRCVLYRYKHFDAHRANYDDWMRSGGVPVT